MSTITMDLPSKAGTAAPMSEEERELRVKLAACYRIFDHIGWSLLIFNHITVRVPGPEHHFLINPYGLRYDEVTASNLVKIDTEGNKLDNSPWAVNRAGFVIHSAIHGHVPEAMCVMHTHTREGLAVASKKQGLTNNNFYSSMLVDHVAYHDFEGITTREDEQKRMLASMGTKPIAILRNHGLLVHGRTVEEAFARMWTLQLACEAQVTIESMGGEAIEISREATDESTRVSGLFANQPDACAGVEMFEALQRVIDAKDPGYRD